MPTVQVPTHGYGGLVLDAAADEVRSAGAIDLLNVDLDARGAVRTRDGFAELTASAGATRYDSVFPLSSGSATTQTAATSPGTLADDSGVGTEAWSNPSNAASSNDSRATVSLGNGVISHYLKATNFGFVLPAGATVTGILVEVERSEGSGSVADSRVRIVKGGTIQSTDKADAAPWPVADAYKAYGSSSDLWGTTWADTDIESSGFGVAIAARGETAGAQARIDHIRITVYYTADNTGYVLAAAAGSRIDAIDADGSVAVTVATASDERQSYAAFGSPSVTAVYIANREATIRKYAAAAFSQPAGMPEAKFVAVQSPDNRLVAANIATIPTGASSTATTSLVHFSAAGNAESWGADDFVYLTPGDGENIQGMAAWRELVIVWKVTKFFVFWGNDTDATGEPVFNYRPVTTGIGLVAPLAVAPSPNGVYFLDRGGVYLTTGGPPVRVSRPIDPLFIGGASSFYLGDSVNPAAFDNASMCWFEERLYVGLPTGSATTNNRTLVYDPANEYWTIWDIPMGAMCALRSQPARLVFTYAQGTNDLGQYAQRAYSDDAGTAITSRYRTGLYDLGSNVEKRMRAVNLWGSGTVDFKLSSNFGSLGTATSATLGTSPVVARAQFNKAGDGTLFSHEFSASSGQWTVHRCVLELMDDSRLPRTKTP